MLFQRVVLTLLLSICFAAQAQETPPTTPQAPIDNDFVQKAFGPSCVTIPAMPPMMADLNGDGVEDVVVPARCKEPMMDAVEHGYTVLDPRNAFYGFGNPTITTQYSTELPEDRGLTLLIIHGSGKETWRSSAAKEKFLIVNLAFKDAFLRRLVVRKKPVTAIYVRETGSDQMTSALFWDGKKYKYQPVGASME